MDSPAIFLSLPCRRPAAWLPPSPSRNGPRFHSAARDGGARLSRGGNAVVGQRPSPHQHARCTRCRSFHQKSGWICRGKIRFKRWLTLPKKFRLENCKKLPIEISSVVFKIALEDSGFFKFNFEVFFVQAEITVVRTFAWVR